MPWYQSARMLRSRQASGADSIWPRHSWPQPAFSGQRVQESRRRSMRPCEALPRDVSRVDLDRHDLAVLRAHHDALRRDRSARPSRAAAEDVERPQPDENERPRARAPSEGAWEPPPRMYASASSLEIDRLIGRVDVPTNPSWQGAPLGGEPMSRRQLVLVSLLTALWSPVATPAVAQPQKQAAPRPAGATEVPGLVTLDAQLDALSRRVAPSVVQVVASGYTSTPANAARPRPGHGLGRDRGRRGMDRHERPRGRERAQRARGPAAARGAGGGRVDPAAAQPPTSTRAWWAWIARRTSPC